MMGSRWIGAHVVEKSTGRSGVVNEFSPAWLSVVWETRGDAPAAKKGYRRGDAEALKEVQIWTASGGWREACEVFGTDAARATLDAVDAASPPPALAASSGGSEEIDEDEDYLTPKKKKGRYGPDPLYLGKYKKNVLKGVRERLEGLYGKEFADQVLERAAAHRGR